jgi:male-specific lethal 3
MDIFESKDKRGRKQMEYLVHFQGWSSNWDRRVSEDFVLRDTEENRKLQRDLAEKSQLQLGAYLYRKERKKRRKLSEKIKLLQMKANSEGGATAEDLVVQPEQEDDSDKITDPEEYYSSSTVESYHEDDRVFLQMGELLKLHLEVDKDKITKEKMLVKLPAAVSAVTILENFVKYYAIQQITGPQETPKPKRRLSSILARKPEAKLFDIKQIANNIELCKEVADGLRIYLNFILKDFLLYAEERQQVEEILSPENLKKFVFTPDKVTLDILPNKEDASGDQEDSKSDANRRLRSHSIRNDDSENTIFFDFRQENLSSMASTSSNESISLASQKTNKLLLKGSIPPVAKKLFDEVLAWKIIPADAPVEPSMLFGLVHLTRLVIKLPEFLSATPISEEKLILLLKYLNHFCCFLENHEHLYLEQNYKKATSEDDAADIKPDSGNLEEKKVDIKTEVKEESGKSPKTKETEKSKNGNGKKKEKPGKSPVPVAESKEQTTEEIELIDERFR